MINLTNENLLTLIFTSFTPKANNNILIGIKNKTISKVILVLADYKKIFKSIELDFVIAKSRGVFSSVALLQNGNIISAAREKVLKLWNINDNSCKLLAIGQVVSNLLVLSNGKVASCYCQYNYINIWDIKANSDPECVKTIAYERCKNIIKLFLLSDLNIACSVILDNGVGILILDSKNEYNCIQSFLVHNYAIESLISIPNNRIASGNDTTIKVWDLIKGICVRSLTGHKDFINSLIFIKRDNSLVSGSHDKSIKIWSLNDFQCLKTIQLNYEIISLLLLPGGYFASGGYNSIKIWDTNNYEYINTLKNQDGWVDHLLLTKDRTIVSTFNYDTMVIWKF
jgi:WD40 repeat protein